MVDGDGFEVRVRVRGTLTPEWRDLFGDVSMVTTPEGTTVIAGRLADQAALHGLLGTVRDLGLSLLSIEARCMAAAEASVPGAGRGGSDGHD